MTNKFSYCCFCFTLLLGSCTTLSIQAEAIKTPTSFATNTNKPTVQTPTPAWMLYVPVTPDAVDWDQWIVFNLRDTSIFGDYGTSVYALSIAPNGDVWVNLKDALGKYDGSKWTVYPIDDEISSHITFYTAKLVATAKDKIWITTGYHHGFGWDYSPSDLISFDGEHWKVEFTDIVVTQIVSGRAQDVWFSLVPTECEQNNLACGGGLLRYDGMYWTHFTSQTGLLSNVVYDIALDQNGRLWAATDQGISMFDGLGWVSFSDMIADGILFDYSGNLWTWTNKDGSISMFDGENLTMFTGIRSQIFQNCQPRESFFPYISLSFSPDGKVYALIQRCGLAVFSNDTWTGYPTSHISLDHWLSGTYLCVTMDNQVWVQGISGNLYKFVDGSWIQYSNARMGQVNNMQCAPNGSIWMISSYGEIGHFIPDK